MNPTATIRTTPATTPATTDDGVEVSRAVVRHGTHVLVDVADLHLRPGRALTVVGESGSGKSVLAHALMGTLPRELEVEGSVRIGGTAFDLADRRGRRHLWGSHLALLPQEPSLALDPTMRVRRQVAEGVRGWRPRDRGALLQADRQLAGLGLRGVGAAYPHTLSGGMAQRVAHAAATIGGTHVLVVDEPSKGLDLASVDRLADLLLAHVEGGGVLLTITHDLRLARRLGGDVLVMRDASVVEAGPVGTVLDTPAHDYTRRLLAAEPSRWRHPWTASRTPSAPPGPPLVSARSVSVSYGDHAVLTDVSVDVGAGERWALTGPSGAGKTTLGDVLLGLRPVDAGAVVVDPGARGRVQKLYQDPGLSFPRRVALGRGLHDVAVRHGVDRVRVATLLDRVGLPADLLDRRPGQVSGGELQRVAVVRAMLTRPALVVADEATSRLDLATQEATIDLLMTELDDTGCALVLVTHDHALATATTERTLEVGRPGSA